MLQTLSELNFIPSTQPDYKEYRKYFKILDICTDSSFNIDVLRSQYQKLKLLFSQTPSNALYSLDSMGSYLIELDDAYKNLYQYLSNIHKNMNSSIQEQLNSSPSSSNSLDYDFPFSGRVEENSVTTTTTFQDNFTNVIDTSFQPSSDSSYTTTTTVSNLNNNGTESSYKYDCKDTINPNTSYNNTDTSNLSNIEGAVSAPNYTQSSVLSSSLANQDLSISNILENSDLRLGSTYKYIRECLNISLEDIQDKTKISTYYLNSIETNNFKNFQAIIFLKGFFKSYLKCLKIPRQEECLNIYINNAKQELSNSR